MNTTTKHITINTRYESGNYIASIGGIDLAKSPVSAYRAARKAATATKGEGSNAKEVHQDVFRLIEP